MSGIITILNTDGAPVDPELVTRLTACMADRGPDGQATHVEGPVGMGHTAFHTTVEAVNERQPLTFDGLMWLNADARIDNRAELRRELTAAGREVAREVTDADFILHAYHAWGTDCVHYLIGDFAFTLWDAPQQRLFCARDHFGVRQLFFAAEGSSLVVGTDIGCLRQHPSIPPDLDEVAIADYLLIGLQTEAELTAYAAIRRLAPAHILIWESGATHVAPYWTVPNEEVLSYRRPQAYVEHFKELFREAVNDRLRAPRISIFMSGGLDSTSIAAVAKEGLARQYGEFLLYAQTTGYKTLPADRETHFASIAARHLGIAHGCSYLDNYAHFLRWNELVLRMPEPAGVSMAAWDYDRMADITAHSKIILDGNGGDPLFSPEPSFYYALLGRARLRLVARSLYHCARERCFSPLYLRTWLRRSTRGALRPIGQLELPAWVNADLVSRVRPQERWRVFMSSLAASPAHPRPEASAEYAAMTFWSAFFNVNSGGYGIQPFEIRYPFFDLRLVNFALRLPAAPWCVDKHLLRSAMTQYLPDQVRMRPKTPFRFLTQHVLSAEAPEHVFPQLRTRSAELAPYGDLDSALNHLMSAPSGLDQSHAASLRMAGLASWIP